jgi:glycosyltransferase involved in cell wall biosynthesis
MTGSGNILIRWSLIAALRAIGYEVGIVVFDPKADRKDHIAMHEKSRHVLSDIDCSLWYFNRGSILEGEQEISRIVEEYKPDVVLCYGTEAFKLSSLLPDSVKRAIMLIDLDHLPDLYRAFTIIRFGGWRTRLLFILRSLRRILKTSWRIREEMLDQLRKADFLIDHAANHASWLQNKLRKPCLYVPNPVFPLMNHPPDEIELPLPPRFILLGGLGGIATLSGLYFFADAVLPHLRHAISKGVVELHLIGRGDLESKLVKKFKMAGIIQRGFVEDVDEEFCSAWALLVPTPIRLGFRTRILDAFRHRLCVVAHEANAAGFPELQHRKNCLLAGNGYEFASRILEVATDGALRRRLSEQAYLDFQTNLSAHVVCRKIITFMQNQNVYKVN